MIRSKFAVPQRETSTVYTFGDNTVTLVLAHPLGKLRSGEVSSVADNFIPISPPRGIRRMWDHMLFKQVLMSQSFPISQVRSQPSAKHWAPLSSPAASHSSPAVWLTWPSPHRAAP